MSSEQNTQSKPKRNNRNRRYKKKPKNPTGQSAAPQSASSSSGANKKRRNNNRKSKPLTAGKMLLKYENLMEQYILARRKFYDLFGREKKEKQLDKAKRNYNKSLEDLRGFETKLSEPHKEILDKKINAYPEDRHYTTSNNIEPVGDIVAFTGNFEDPHLLNTQKSENWAADTEESSGTIEDYQRYKEGRA